MSLPVVVEEAERQLGRVGDPCTMVIFGATGDLTRRKLLPSLYNLAAHNLLSREFALVGMGRESMTSEQFRDKMTHEVKEFATCELEKDLWDWLVRRTYYIGGELADPTYYAQLRDLLQTVDKNHGTQGNYLYYLATAPMFFATIVKQLGKAAIASAPSSWRRVIIEKPFGRDLDSARGLNRELRRVLKEDQIYRIDHYLGKETVQNILAFRFSNGIFEPVWNRRYIDHVQITVAETVGVEGRGGYYDQAGTLRDMVPNHIFQLVSLVAMEPPISFQANSVRDEQAKILHAIQPLNPEDVITRAVRGQYGEGVANNGAHVLAYRSEPNVSPDSQTETFAAMKLLIDNWRWVDVPFYLRTGKRMPKRRTEVTIQFRRAPFILFRDTPVEKLTPNLLVLHIQPEEGISLRFGAKIPGPVMQLGNVNMKFNYTDYFGSNPSTGYERLLHDCMVGDATLFQRDDMVEAGWSVVNPILDVWKALPPRNFPNYASGTWGPREADELIERDHRHWREDEK